jgi:LmbE family N-acetylglucosaminyl deacetylase
MTLRSQLKTLLFRHASPEINLLLMHLKGIAKREPLPRSYCLTDVVGKRRVLVLSPHPDDEVIGAGGTLALHLDQGSDVTVLYVTSGGSARGSVSAAEMAGRRRSEAESVAERYALKQVFWGEDDGHLTVDDRTTTALRDLIAAVRPDEIYAPSYFDTHRDHLTTNQILVRALTQGSLPETMVLGYEVWTAIPFPNHFVDITSRFPAKIDMLSSYRSQLEMLDFERLCRSRNNMNYILSSYHLKRSDGYAEAFLRHPAAVYLDHASAFFSLIAGSKS